VAQATRVVAAIDRRDAEHFMTFVSSKGIGFGVDAPLVSRVELDRELRASTGHYCLLFSSGCIRAASKLWHSDPVLSKFSRSYRDWFRGNRNYKIDAELLTESDFCGGLVTFAGTNNQITPGTLELQFTLEGAQWRLINTPYELGE
jgi:hypothetical protein